MSCVFPVDAWRAAECNDSGKRGIVFNIRHGLVDQPLQVPCGKCVGCRVDRSRVWAVRMYHEASLHDRNCFVTLTYRDAPEFISVRDVQLFIKRLRRRFRVRYFATGEYGSVSHRAHYHLVVFGEDFRNGSYSIDDRLYGHPYLDRAWGHGFVSVGDVSLASCMYVAGYATKKIGDPDVFNIMSRRPGIGRGWVDRYWDDIRRTETIVIGGKEFPIPLRYLEWYADELVVVKESRKQFVDNMSADDVWQRRVFHRGREINYNARLSMVSESI